MPFRLTKVTRSANMLRYAGVGSDTRPDMYRTRMSLKLFQQFLKRRSQFEPYSSVSHYLHPIGTIDKLYIDGRYLKFTGELDLTNGISRALAESLDDPEFRSQVGFSIGFDDDDYYIDNSVQGGLRTYVDGLLIHIAFTTIPANPRSRLISLELRRANSQYDDASKLVGPVFASYLEDEYQRLRGKGRLYCDHIDDASFLVLRHGSHNQKDHGHRGPGAPGGGGDAKGSGGAADTKGAGGAATIENPKYQGTFSSNGVDVSYTPASAAYLNKQPEKLQAKLADRYASRPNGAERPALEALISVPSSGTHVVDGRTFKETIEVQLPKKTGGERERLENAIKGKPFETVKLDPKSLTATQTYISRDGIAGAINGAAKRPGYVREGYTTQIARTKNGFMIVDGHHRTHAAIFLKEPSIEVQLYDLR